MLKYNIKYDEMFLEGIENLKLPDGKYKIYTSFSYPMLIKKQSKDILYGRFEIRDAKIWSLTFEKEILNYYNSISKTKIYKDLILADNMKKLIIEKDEDKVYYYYFDEDMKLLYKEFKDDELDKQNKNNLNYFDYLKYEPRTLENKMKEHIKNHRLNLLSTFIPQ